MTEAIFENLSGHHSNTKINTPRGGENQTTGNEIEEQTTALLEI